MMRLHVPAAAALLLAGCTTVMPVSKVLDVDPETAPSCARVCKQVGMRVGAIVFIRNMGGCVCEPEAAAPRADASGGAATMGGAVVVVLEEERRRQDEQRQQQQTSSQSGAGAASIRH
jgi:hypothetical protein